MEYLIRDHQRERLTIALALLAMTVAAPCAAKSSSSDPAVTIDFANGLYARRMYGPAVGEYEKFIRLNPDSPELPSARFRAADSRYFSGSYKSAVFYFKEFIRDFPGDGRVPMARFRTALARYHLGEFAPAARIFVALAKESPDPLLRSGALFYLGKIYESRKNPERALEIFRRLMGLYPRSEYSAYAALAMGERFIGERDFASAAGAYEFAAKVADASPENAALREKALLGLFACDYSRRDLKTALRRWQSHKAFIAGSACEPQILYLLADLESEKREGSLSVHFLEKVIGHPQADDGLKEKAFFKKCETLSAIGEAEEALAGLEEYLNGGKGDLSRAGYEKARALEALGRAEEAARIYRGLVTTVPESAWTEQALYEKTLLKIIEIDLDRRDYAKASEEAAAFVRERPGSRFLDAAHYKLGVSLAGLKDYGRAAEAFGKVGEGSPWHGRALYGLAACLENQKLPDAAIRAYEKINALYPGSGFSDEAFSRLVYLYLQSGEPEKAALLCGEILSAKPTVRIYPDAAFWLAEYLLGRCRRLGPGCGAWAEAMYRHRGAYGIRSLQGLLHLAKDIPVHQLESAAARALEHACWRLRDLRALALADDKVVQLGFLQAHPLIRDLSAYRIAFPS
ncbi:MAG: tetratricopeptide repeat protein [Candidatus Omnitrophica bacterium]|nr:tetratricopeptide repeat protein [Candidatus Omnitrophota bacterium]